MEDILKPNYICRGGETEECPVTQLLIEGAPGIGKSTFAWVAWIAWMVAWLLWLVAWKWDQWWHWNETNGNEAHLEQGRWVPGMKLVVED